MKILKLLSFREIVEVHGLAQKRRRNLTRTIIIQGGHKISPYKIKL
jgi:hypothetical protein